MWYMTKSYVNTPNDVMISLWIARILYLELGLSMQSSRGISVSSITNSSSRFTYLFFLQKLFYSMII